MFIQLDQKQELEFRQWARKNYHPGTPIPGIWHPVVQDECVQINREVYGFAEKEDKQKKN